MKNVEEMIAKVSELYENDAIHVKRGFRLRTQGNSLVASNHLMEEVAEFQAEIIECNREFMLEEAGDVFMIFCHILKRNNISLDEVAASACEKLKRSYTLDPAQVTAIKAGVTRRGRK